MMANQRFCLTLDLIDNPALINQYIHYHQKGNIWPEIPEGIRRVGIEQMEIFRLGTRLFMIIDASPDFDFSRDMAALSDLPRQKDWEEFVSQFQVADPVAGSAEKWKLMEKIFDLKEYL